MGKGDRKTAKGKRYNSSYGNARKQGGVAAKLAVTEKVAVAKKATKTAAKSVAKKATKTVAKKAADAE